MRPGGLIGAVHLPPMPGDPRHGSEGFSRVREVALHDAEALVRGGCDALVVENFGSAPFAKGTREERVPPHQLACLSLVGWQCRRELGVAVGLNCLRNDAIGALGAAAAAELDFVRINVHTGAQVTDQGLIEGEAHRSLRYRRHLGADRIALLADVLVKHASPLADTPIEVAVQDCLERGLADAVLVTGPATGAAVDSDQLERARAAAGDRPLLIGSGLTPQRAPTLAPLADGAIVGSWVKRDASIHGPVDEDRVRQLADVTRPLFRSRRP